jgi:hypothetical protein
MSKVKVRHFKALLSHCSLTDLYIPRLGETGRFGEGGEVGPTLSLLTFDPEMGNNHPTVNTASLMQVSSQLCWRTKSDCFFDMLLVVWPNTIAPLFLQGLINGPLSITWESTDPLAAGHRLSFSWYNSIMNRSASILLVWSEHRGHGEGSCSTRSENHIPSIYMTTNP